MKLDVLGTAQKPTCKIFVGVNLAEKMEHDRGWIRNMRIDKQELCAISSIVEVENLQLSSF